MDLQVKQNTFNSLLDQFVASSKGSNHDSKVEDISNQLTVLVREHYFIDLGIHLLLTQNYSRQKYILVTSFVKDRFKYDFQLIEQSKLPLYYNKLAEIARVIKNHNNAALTNISLALAYIYINISVHSDQKLETFLQPLLPKPEDPNYTIFNYYFKTQEYIASEINNPKLVIDQQSREIAKNRICAQQYSVLISLNDNGSKAWEMKDIKKECILQCFKEWIILAYNPDVINSLPNHYLMKMMFHCLANDELMDTLTDSIKDIIQIARDPKENGQFFQFLGQNVMQLITIVQKFIQNSQMTSAEEYLSIILDFSRKSVNVFVTRFDLTKDFISKLIAYTKDDLLQIYDNLIDFWQIFIEEMTAVKQSLTNFQQISIMLVGLYDVLCYRCNYPLKYVQQLNKRYQEKLGDFNQTGRELCERRERTQELFQKISMLLGKKEYINFVSLKIKNVERDQANLWSYLQVYLFSLVLPLKKLQKISPEVLMIVQTYSQFRNTPNLVLPIIIRRTFLKIFRSLLSIQQKNAQLIQQLFFFTSTCFQQPLLMDTAQRTFWKGCELNYSIIKSNIVDLMNILQLYPRREYIVRGLTIIIINDEQLIVQYLPGVLNYLYETLQKAEATGSKGAKKNCMYSLLGVVKELKENVLVLKHMDIIKQFIKSMWEYIKFVLSNPRQLEDDQDPEVERMVKFLKHLMRCMKFQFTQFVQDLYHTILQAYQKYPVCSYVYLVQIAITVFSSDPKFTQYLKNVYIQFCNATYSYVSKIQNIQKYVYLLDDFIGMNKRFFIYNASIVLSSGQLPALMQLCINAFMGCTSPRVAKASYAFFQTIFMVYWRQQFIDQFNTENQDNKFELKSSDVQYYIELRIFLAQKVEHIVTKMLEHLSHVPNQATRQCILHALLAEIKAFGPQNQIVWQTILAKLPSDILVSNQKQRFKQFIERMSISDIKQVQQTTVSIRRYIYLINRRMMSSANRKDIRI